MRAMAVLAWLAVALAITSADAMAQIQWTEQGASPREIDLAPCHGPSGFIEERLSHADLAKRYGGGLTGNVQAVADEMERAGWQKSGPPGKESLYVRLNYRVECDARARFWVRERNHEGMTTGTQLLPGGGCHIKIDERAAKYLSNDKKNSIKKLNADFQSARRKELEALRPWNGMPHKWTGAESQQLETNSRGRFRRTLEYNFCGRGHRTVFYVSWRAPAEPKKPKAKSK